MKYPLTRRQHAALALLLLVVTALAIYYVLLIPAFTSRMSYLDRLEDLRFQYHKLGQSIGREDELNREIRQLKQSLPDRSGYLENQSPALAAADLQKYFSNVVSDTGGNLVSTQVLQDQGDGLFPEITVKAHLRCDIESLQRLLYQLGANDPVLIVDNLMIQQRDTGGRAGAGMIEVRFDLTGYMYQEKPAS